MTTIQYFRDLHLQVDQYIYVLSKEKIYVLHDGEYVHKPYLYVEDLAIITGRGESVIRKLCLKLGMTNGVRRRIRLTIDQFKVIHTDLQHSKPYLPRHHDQSTENILEYLQTLQYENQDH